MWYLISHLLWILCLHTGEIRGTLGSTQCLPPVHPGNCPQFYSENSNTWCSSTVKHFTRSTRDTQTTGNIPSRTTRLLQTFPSSCFKSGVPYSPNITTPVSCFLFSLPNYQPSKDKEQNSLHMENTIYSPKWHLSTKTSILHTSLYTLTTSRV